MWGAGSLFNSCTRCGEAVVPCSCALKVVSVGRRKPFLQIPVARDVVILHTYDTLAQPLQLHWNFEVGNEKGTGVLR